MTGFHLAVDYGTSNTVAMLAWPDGRVRPLLFDGAPLLPSGVYAQPDGTVLTGRDAQRSTRLDPARFEGNPKRRIDDVEVLLGERSWPVVELITRTLSRVAAEAFRTAGGQIGSFVMTCPVEWGPVRKDRLTTAAQKAGLPTPLLVPEPTAAAAYYAGKLSPDGLGGRCVVVYDLGGGTFDVSVVRREGADFRPLAHRGIDDFGGVDLDELVMTQIGHAVDPAAWQRIRNPADATDRRHARVLWDDARTAKEELSRRSSADVLVPIVDREAHVSREAFEQAARPPLERTVEVTKATVREAQVTQADLAGIFLVGGSSRVPLVSTLLHQAFGIAPNLLEQPETVVAEGALMYRQAAAPAPPKPVAVPAPPQYVAAAPAPQYAPAPPVQTWTPPPVPPPAAPRYQPMPQHNPYPQAQPPTPSKPGPPVLPLTGGLLAALGLAASVAGKLSGHRDTGLAYGLVGLALFLAGGVIMWFWPRFPLMARFGAVGGMVLLSVFYVAVPTGHYTDYGKELPPDGAGIFMMATIVALVVTVATLGVRRKGR